MNAAKSFLLLRARPEPGARERFGRWFVEAHLRDVGRIPGIDRVEHGVTAAGTWLGIYSFAEAESVRTALGSAEAAYARGTWAQWAADLEQLEIEVVAPLMSLPIYQLSN